MSDDFEEFKPVTYEAMKAMSAVSVAELLSEDFEHFTYLSRTNQTSMYLVVKKLVPMPEFKEDHKFLCEQMKEHMAYEDNPVEDKPIPTPPPSDEEVDEIFDGDKEKVEPPNLGQPEIASILAYIDGELTGIKAKVKTNNWDGGRRSALKQIRNLIVPD